MKLEVVVIPVSDVDRAKRFYGDLGWRLDADFVVGDDVSGRPVHASGLAVLDPLRHRASRRPCRARHSGLYLVVSDIEAARAELVDRGVEVSEVFHRAGPGKPPRQRSGIRRGAATSLTPRSAIRTATNGCCRRSPPGSRAGSTRTRRASPPHRIWRARCGARRPPTASTRSAWAASEMRTGRTGTPSTWWRSRPARSCRHEQSFDVIVVGGSPGSTAPARPHRAGCASHVEQSWPVARLNRRTGC